jgi:phospholipase D1/2
MGNPPELPKASDYFVNYALSPRENAVVQPLVDGVATFSSMEEAIVAAKTSVYLAMWIFRLDTPLQSKKVSGPGQKMWVDLLRATASRGVSVRLLLTGFDPLLGSDKHRNNWLIYRQLAEVALSLGKQKELLKTIVSLHSATLSDVGGQAKKILTGQVEYLNGLYIKSKTAALQTYSDWPGLWKMVEFNSRTGRFTIRSGIALQIFPAAHHQKLCIVDDALAYIGGLDVTIGRIATPSHTYGPNMPGGCWHDVDARMEDAPALDICNIFIDRWNREAPDFEKFIEEANKTSPPMPLPPFKAGAPLALKTTKPPVPGNAWVQIQQTRSVDNKFSLVPRTVQDDIRRGYQKAISLAQQFIYIENQYVRSKELGEWIISRDEAIKEQKKVSDLRVMIVVPTAPEEVGETGKGDELTEHGLALQYELFTILQKTLKDRIGIFSLVAKGRAPVDSKTNAFGSLQIYVHTKLLLVDDCYANIGSANANPRSFHVDTEIAAAWFEPAAVKQLRLCLWKEMLGGAAGIADWKPVDFIKEWNKIAIANEKSDVNRRQGFVIRHDMKKFPGKKMAMLPDEFV